MQETTAARREGTVHSSFLAGVRSPWLFIAIAAAAALAFAFSGLAVTGLPLVRETPILPAPPDGDPTLYGLVVPAPAPRQVSGSAPVSLARLQLTQYRMRSGDTLSRIASRFKLNLDTVVSWNGIRDARGFAAGTVLDLPNTDGLKTGWVRKAGYHLVATAKRGDTRLIAVVMGAKNPKIRSQEAEQLLDEGFRIALAKQG